MAKFYLGMKEMALDAIEKLSNLLVAVLHPWSSCEDREGREGAQCWLLAGQENVWLLGQVWCPAVGPERAHRAMAVRPGRWERSWNPPGSLLLAQGSRQIPTPCRRAVVKTPPNISLILFSFLPLLVESIVSLLTSTLWILFPLSPFPIFFF